MIQLDLVVFLLLIEALVIFAVLFFIWLVRSRRLATALAAAVARVKSLVKRPDARQYLLTEANMTRDHVRALGEKDELMKKLLALRAEFLQMEHDAADKDVRDQPFWEALSKQFDALIATHDHPDSGIPAARRQASGGKVNIEAETAKTKSLFDEQSSIIRQLKKQVRDAIQDSTKAEILEKQIDRITSANRELSYCVTTLESEIVDLKAKITALEKQARTKAAAQQS
jgi:hypothetical protein